MLPNYKNFCAIVIKIPNERKMSCVTNNMQKEGSTLVLFPRSCCRHCHHCRRPLLSADRVPIAAALGGFSRASRSAVLPEKLEHNMNTLSTRMTFRRQNCSMTKAKVQHQ